MQCKIEFAKNNRAPIEVAKGSPLMKVLLQAGVPVASSCHGDGICAKCRLKIVAGSENLTPVNETEAFLQEKFKLAKDQRISCQVEINGDIVIDTTYW